MLCNCDDASKFIDTLYFVIKEGVDIEVTLKAKGTDFTIYCNEDLNNINFGVIFTHRPYVKEIFIENLGRRPQTVSWARKKKVEKKKVETKKGKE